MRRHFREIIIKNFEEMKKMFFEEIIFGKCWKKCGYIFEKFQKTSEKILRFEELKNIFDEKLKRLLGNLMEKIKEILRNPRRYFKEMRKI